MIKRKRWAIALMSVSVIMIATYEFKDAVAYPTEEVNTVVTPVSQNQALNPEIAKEKYSTLENFIQGILTKKDISQDVNSLANNELSEKQLDSEPFTFLKTEDMLKKNDFTTEHASRIEKIKVVQKMQKLSHYIADNYDIPLDRAERIVYITFVESMKKNLEPLMVLSLISVESMFKQNSRSHAGAVGLTQVMAKVHKSRIAQQRIDIWSIHGNIQVGTDILKDYVVLAKGNTRKALQMYNGSARDGSYQYSNKVMRKMQSFQIASR